MDEFLGSIMLWPLNRIPKGWLLCNGQLLNIQQNAALFSLLGIQYGGDGVNTFALPDLRSRVPVGAGQGQERGVALSNYVPGDKGGTEHVMLNANQLPAHNHTIGQSTTPGELPSLQVNANMPASAQSGYTDTPGNNAVPAKAPDISSFGIPPLNVYGNADGNTTLPVNVTLQGQTSLAGGGQPHENRQPYLALNYIICAVGYYPDFS